MGLLWEIFWLHGQVCLHYDKICLHMTNFVYIMTKFVYTYDTYDKLSGYDKLCLHHDKVCLHQANFVMHFCLQPLRSLLAALRRLDGHRAVRRVLAAHGRSLQRRRQCLKVSY